MRDNENVMKKIIFIGRVGAGKTTLTQALRNQNCRYHKTQYIDYGDFVIDTPGEYAQCHEVSSALALYAYEVDVVGLLIASNEQYSIFPPNITCLVNREVIGIVTKINLPDGNVAKAEKWLRISGCKKIFYVDAKTGDGVEELKDYLKNQ